MGKFVKVFGLMFAAAAIYGCTSTTASGASDRAQFFTALQSLCGQEFAGQMVSNDPADADFAGKALRARAGECSADEVRIAFDVGEDRSRTWIITRTDGGLRLKHRHLLADGSIDPVSNYGGDTTTIGSAQRQEFPVDAFSKDLFVRAGLTASVANIWAFEIEQGKALTYELARPNRLFRVRFDLSPVQ